MRRRWLGIGEEDRRAMAGGAAAGFGLTAALALRADWVLLDGILAFHRTGRNVAAYLMGLDLLPWTLLLTAATLAGAVAALGMACQAERSPAPRQGAQHGRRGEGSLGRPQPAGR